jgi:hypothetical protein
VVFVIVLLALLAAAVVSIRPVKRWWETNPMTGSCAWVDSARKTALLDAYRAAADARSRSGGVYCDDSDPSAASVGTAVLGDRGREGFERATQRARRAGWRLAIESERGPTEERFLERCFISSNLRFSEIELLLDLDVPQQIYRGPGAVLHRLREPCQRES